MTLSKKQKDEALALLTGLVETPSPYFEEKAVMELVVEHCKEIHLPIRKHEYFFEPLDFSGLNLYGELRGGPGPLLYLGGHLDTVLLASGWKRDPYKVSLEEDKAYGLGILDMKAGCAAILTALKAFKEDYPEFKGSILYHFASVEEGPYGLGTTFFLRDILKEDVDFAIITEPSSALAEIMKPSISLGAKGGYQYKVILKGVSAHAATPHLGISAAEEGARLIPLLNHLETESHPLMGKGASCVIGFHSGSGACSVPDEATIDVFRHCVPGENLESILKEVEEVLKSAQLNCNWEIKFRDPPVEGFDGGFPPYFVDLHHPYVKALKELLHKKYEDDVLLLSSQAIGDFNLLGGVRKIPTVLMGPLGNNIHQPDEYLLVDSYYKTIEILYEFLEELLIS